MSRPRVAYVAHSVDPRRGGMELVSARLLERLAEVVDLEVVAGDGLETLPPGVRRTRVPIPTRPSIARLVIFDVVASLRLLAVQRRVDLVHTCGAVAHARADLVTVHLNHAQVIAAQGGHRPPGRAGARGAVAGLRRRLAASLERWLLRPNRTRCVAAVSRADARALATRYPELRVEVVEDGADLDRFERADRPPRTPDEPMRVVVVSGDFERKGVPLAIRAVAATRRCRLRVVGDGDLAAMRALAEALDAADRVELAGHRRDVDEEYAAADVVLSCSVHESFGLALVEGAAAGCAVVCTDTGVGPELCDDHGAGPGGVVVHAVAGEIAAVLDELDADPTRCAALGRAATANASRFTWDEMTTATIALYDALLGSPQ